MNYSIALPDGLDIGGVNSWSVGLARELARRGKQVLLIEHEKPGAMAEIDIDRGVRRQSIPGRHPDRANRSDIRRYDAVYGRDLPSVVIPNYTVGTYAACSSVSSQKPGDIRVIGFCHSDHKYYYDLLGYYEPMIHQFVAVSDAIAEKLTQMLPHRVSDIVTMPYGVAIPERLDRRYSPSGQPLKLVYAGRLEESQKRVSDLLALARLLHNAGVDFTLRIVGDGEAAGDMKSAVSRLGADLQTRIFFTGRLSHDKMHSVWQEADVCLLVSSYEGTSISMLEAMANGCVPVVTEVSGTSAVIQPGQNGFVVDVGDLEKMSCVIKDLADRRNLLEDMGQSAFQTARKTYSMPSYLDWLVKQLEDIWEKPPRPWPRFRPLISPRIMVRRVLCYRPTWYTVLSGRTHTKRASSGTV
jgi:glycosyltransferase involved in cell wall biosynthesis